MEYLFNMDHLTPVRAGMPLQGNINNLVIFIRFQDESEFTRTIPYYEALFNSTAEGADSVYNFFHQTSYSQVNVTSTFYSKNGNAVVSYQDAYPRSYYLPYNQTTNPNGYTTATRAARETELLKNALLASKSEIEASGLNLDIDNDGNIDSITFVVHGPTAADYWGTLLAPHSASIESQNIQIGGKTAEEYAFMIDDTLFTGLLVHEMLHQMGFEDYYQYSGRDGYPIWTWDTMGASTVSPANTSAYSKYQYGEWISNIPTIRSSQRVTLIPLSEPAGALMNCCKIETSNPNQYLVLEYRIKTQTGVDSNIPGTGLLIYRVNEEKEGEGNAYGPPWELYLFRPNVTISQGKYAEGIKNAVLISDGDVEKAFLSRQSGRTEAGTSDFPIFFEDGTDMGIRISNVGEAGDTISFDVSIATTPTADVGVTKTASSVSVNPDTTLTYTVVVSNAGPNTATGVRLIDTTPSALSNPQYSLDNGTTWRSWTSPYSIGDIANGDSVTILIRGIVNSTAIGSIENTAIVTTTTTDPNPTNNTTTVVTPINTPTADVSVVKTTTSTSVAPGDQIIYSIAIANAGPSTAQGIVLNDIVPATLQSMQYSLNNGTTWQNWTGSYRVGTLVKGAATTILLRGTVRSDAKGRVNNLAQVTSTTIDPDLTNNASSVTIPINAPQQSADISVTKTADTAVAKPGDVITYTIVVSNAGPDTASAVSLVDVVPSMLTNVAYSINNGTTWKSWSSPYVLGDLANDASRTVLIRGTVGDSATGQIVNTAIVRSSTLDPNETNNTDTVRTLVIIGEGADLEVTQSVNQVAFYPGQEIVYTIVVTNSGPETAENVVINDVLPMGVTNALYSVNATPWRVWNGRYVLGNLAAGETAIMTIRGIIARGLAGNMVNTVTVTSTTSDPTSNNNTAQVDFTILRGQSNCKRIANCCCQKCRSTYHKSCR